jgi:hypothetical protein
VSPTSRAVTIGGFVVLGLALLACQALARRERSRIPSAGELLTAAMRRRPGRIAVLLAWWWLGWHFLARSGQLET